MVQRITEHVDALSSLQSELSDKDASRAGAARELRERCEHEPCDVLTRMHTGWPTYIGPIKASKRGLGTYGHGGSIYCSDGRDAGMVHALVLGATQWRPHWRPPA